MLSVTSSTSIENTLLLFILLWSRILVLSSLYPFLPLLPDRCHSYYFIHRSSSFLSDLFNYLHPCLSGSSFIFSVPAHFHLPSLFLRFCRGLYVMRGCTNLIVFCSIFLVIGFCLTNSLICLLLHMAIWFSYYSPKVFHFCGKQAILMFLQ